MNSIFLGLITSLISFQAFAINNCYREAVTGRSRSVEVTLEVVPDSMTVKACPFLVMEFDRVLTLAKVDEQGCYYFAPGSDKATYCYKK